MSARVALLLDADGLRRLEAMAEAPLARTAADGVAEALRRAMPRGAEALLVVGMGVLEAAEPALPPVPPALRLPLLRRESDRFLPLPSGAAVALTGMLAQGMDGAALEGWVAAIEAALPVRAVVTLPQCAAWAAPDGRWSCPAALGEVAEVTVRDGTVTGVRRRRGSTPAGDGAAPPLDVAAVVEAARRRGGVRREEQLLTPALEARLARRRQRAWWGAAAWAACAVALLLAALDLRRSRELARLEARERALVEALEPVRTARARAERAQQELAALAALDAAAAASTAPLRVLAALGTLLPRDAFVQRLEWDGVAWRLDGSARDAAALVPRLAAHPGFGEVRTVAPSQQFLDNGVTRRSFAITVRPRGAAPAADPRDTPQDAPPRRREDGRGTQ